MPSGVLERGVLLPLRFALEHYVNLRPAKLYPGVESPLAVERVAPDGIDFVVVREGTEGPYVGNGGSLRTGTPHEIATEVSVNTRFGVERVVRDAFARAQARPRRHLTLVHKHNVLTHAGHLWRRTVEEVGAEFPDVETAYQHVDAATIFLATDPGRFDVIVTDNLFGDIITDIAAAIAGRHRPRRERQHQPRGPLPEHVRAGARLGARTSPARAKADPTATILSVGMLLAHLGRTDEAERVERAVAADLAERGSGTALDDAPSATPSPPASDRPACAGSRYFAGSTVRSPRKGPASPMSLTFDLHRTTRPRRATSVVPRSTPTPASASTSPTTWCARCGPRTAAGATAGSSPTARSS